jgi:hypothetical protein
MKQWKIAMVVACGEITYGGVEPDAEHYHCENCGVDGVYGLAQLAIMGMIDLQDDGE